MSDDPRSLPRLEAVPPGARLPLDDTDAKPPAELPGNSTLLEHTSAMLERLRVLQAAFHADGRRALLLVLQGRDAAGKDGTIRTVMGACNPMGVRIAAFGPPSTRERSHDFLWRVHKVVPAKGQMGVFNRSHYEDVLVVRVRELAPKAVWSLRYKHIVDFEQMLVDSGTVVVKCMLHISREEQRERLQARLDDPHKNWKFRLGDLEDRERWDDFTRAYRDMITRTSTVAAPWYVVPSDNKKARNFLIAQLLVETLEHLDPQYPSIDPAVAEAAKGFK